MKLRTLGLAVSGLAALALAGGVPVMAQSVFKAAYTTQPPTLDAMMSTSTAARQIAIYLYENLVTIGEDYGVIPQLAESWETSKDGKTWTFKLRSGIKFHNGSDLDAEDVKASYERFAKSPSGARMKIVESITVKGPLLLEFKLTQNAPLLETMAMPLPFITVVPSETVAKYGQDNIKTEDIVGTGPAKLISWRPDVAIRLARNDAYKPDTRFDGTNGMGGKRIINFEEIQIIPATEASARVAGLETGEFDFAEDLPYNTYDDLKDNANVNPVILKPKWNIVMNINKSLYPTSNTYFRQALAAAVDYDAVLKAVTLGKKEFYRENHSIYTAEQSAFHQSGQPPYYGKPDMAKVKALLEKAGYKGEEVIYMSNRDYDWMYKTALAVVPQWKAAGINVKLDMIDWPSELQRMRVKENWHMGQTGWSPRFDPGTNSAVLEGSGETPGSHWYKNPKMNELFVQMNTNMPLPERQKVWKAIQMQDWEEIPYLRVGDIFGLDAVRANVKGYQPWYVTPRFWNVTK